MFRDIDLKFGTIINLLIKKQSQPLLTFVSNAFTFFPNFEKLKLMKFRLTKFLIFLLLN